MLAERAQAWIRQMDDHERGDYCASMLELSIELAFGHPLDEANRTRLSEASEQQIWIWNDRLSTVDTLDAVFDEEVEPSHGRHADRLLLKNSQTPEKIHRMSSGVSSRNITIRNPIPATVLRGSRSSVI